MSARPLLLLAAVASGPLVSAVTPVESVVRLLEGLKEKVVEEGQAEAVAYTRYAGFCRSQADQKTSSITKAQERIELLTGQIDALAGDIKKLNQEIGDLSVEVEGLEKKCAVERKDRQEAHKIYLALEADLADAVSGAREAIQVLKSTRAPNSALAQEKIASFMQLAAAVPLPPDSSQKLMAALASLLDENPNGVVFHSGAVIEKMTDVMTKFKAHKNDLDAEESNKRHAYDLAQMARKHQIQSLTDSIKESKEHVALKEQESSAQTSDRSQTEADVNADTAFLDDLTTQCEDKADAWDARSKTRADEISALTEALKFLKSDVVESLKSLAGKAFTKFDGGTADKKPDGGTADKKPDGGTADKKPKALVAERAATARARGETSTRSLPAVGAGSSATVQELLEGSFEVGKSYSMKDDRGWWWPVTITAKNHDGTYTCKVHDGPGTVWPKVPLENLREQEAAVGGDGEIPGGPSFLQNNLQHRRGNPMREVLLARRAVTYLRKQAREQRSGVLSGLVLQMGVDHFVKVRGMIKDMLQRLEADATSEADHKSWCDGEMERATKARDDNSAAIEGDTAEVTAAESKIARLSEEAQTLLQQIGELKQGMQEATQLRTDEKARNEAAAAAATDGVAGVTSAIQILKDFYGTALVQWRTKYQPPTGDAQGKTVGDLAPKTFSGDYKGQQDAASGILGQLDVIKSDFEGQISATKSAESAAAEEFERDQSESERVVAEKEELVESKRSEQSVTRGTLMDVKDKFKEHTSLKAEALDELAKLKPACVDPAVGYEAKVAQREEEIEALRNAYNILDDMR